MAWHEVPTVGLLGRVTGLVLVATLAAGSVVWQPAAQTTAQAPEGTTVCDESASGSAPISPSDAGATGTSGPGRDTSTTGSSPPNEVSPATHEAVPIGTEQSWEELQCLKRRGERTAGPALDNGTQADPAAD